MKSLVINSWSKGFGFGLAPIASGTFGTLVAIPCYFLCSNFSFIYHLVIWLGFLIISILCAGFTSKQLSIKDPGCIVCDEVIGFWLVLLLTYTDYVSLVFGFLVFRVFDIVKPWPASYFDNQDSGFGIVMDDVVAAIYTIIIMFVCSYFL